MVKEAIRLKEQALLEDAVRHWEDIPHNDQKILWLAPSKGGFLSTAERDYIKNEFGPIYRRITGKGE
jgi:hypothetical protein